MIELPHLSATAAVTIRPMCAADLTAYKALRDRMLATHPQAFSSDAEAELRRSAETYLSRVAGAADRGWPFTLTAWQGERLCGALTCERDQRLKVRHIAKLVGMMVAPEAGRRGIGRALLDATIAQCRQRDGIELLTLSVTGSNATAIRLYERAGFVVYGRLERALRIGDCHHAKHLMALTLDAAR